MRARKRVIQRMFPSWMLVILSRQANGRIHSKNWFFIKTKKTSWDILADMDDLEDGEIQLDVGNPMDLGESHFIPEQHSKEVTVELAAIEEGEIQTDAKNWVHMRDVQNFLDQQYNPLFVCKDADVQENLKGNDRSLQPNPKKKVEKISNSVPKGVVTRSSKLDQQAKVKPNVGTLEKPGRRSSGKARELESM